jgi:hypothetical protein
VQGKVLSKLCDGNLIHRANISTHSITERRAMH